MIGAYVNLVNCVMSVLCVRVMRVKYAMCDARYVICQARWVSLPTYRSLV